MTRHSCLGVSLPTLRVMPSCRLPVLYSAVLLLWVPATARAQNGVIAATATVQALPLSLIGVTRTTVPGELRLRIQGCGAGAITVDARTAAGTVRTLRLPLLATNACAPRDITIQLSEASGTTSEYLVSVDQSNSLLSPSFAQFVVPASLTRHASKTTLGY